jgi:hypothetical protein
MNRRAHVVDESRQRELGRPHAAPHLGRFLPNEDGEPLARQGNRCREPIWARADDEGVRGQETAARAEDRASFSISRAITIRWISCVPS